LYKITSILPTKNKKNVTVIIGGEKMSLSLDLVLQHGLHEGQSLDQETLDHILALERLSLLKRKAHNFISYKPRTTKQVTEYLLNEGADERNLILVTEFLKKFNYLDDRRYAKYYINDLYLKHPMGRKKVLNELLKRGVPRQIAIDEVAGIDDNSEYERLDKLIQKKLKGVLPDNYKEKAKLTKYFISRGFEPEMVIRRLKE